MTKEIKRSQCLTSIYALIYRNNPSLSSLGRYIKALRQEQNLISDITKKNEYEALINNLMQKHIILLQENVLSYQPLKPKSIEKNMANKIKDLSSCQYCVNDNKYSLVDVDGLKKMKIIKNSVLLKDNLVLPCKVKSENQNYKFIVQIIMTPSNVLLNSKNSFEYDYSKSNVNHYTLLTKVGKGITNNELKPKEAILR